MDMSDVWNNLIDSKSADAALVRSGNLQKVLDNYAGLHNILPRYIDLDAQFMLVPRAITIDLICAQLNKLRGHFGQLTKHMLNQEPQTSEGIYHYCLLNKEPIAVSIQQDPVQTIISDDLRSREYKYQVHHEAIVKAGYDKLTKRRQGTDEMLRPASISCFKQFTFNTTFNQYLRGDSMSVLEDLLTVYEIRPNRKFFHVGITS